MDLLRNIQGATLATLLLLSQPMASIAKELSTQAIPGALAKRERR